MTMKTKQRMLTEDWELFKQRRFIEEQVRPRGGCRPAQEHGSGETPPFQGRTALSAPKVVLSIPDKLIFLCLSASSVFLKENPFTK